MPQVEVTFEIDANGIMKVSAVDKATGKSESITITNNRDRLSPEDIERMVQEAEQYGASSLSSQVCHPVSLSLADIRLFVLAADEDATIKRKIEAVNSLQNYLYSLKSQLADKEGLGSKIADDDKKTITAALKEAGEWVEANAEAAADEVEEKLAEVQAIVRPSALVLLFAAVPVLSDFGHPCAFQVNPITSKLYAGAAGGEDSDMPFSHDEL